MSLLTGHRPGAFEGFQMKDLWDKDRWERRERQVQNPRFADEGLPPQMTNWYQGRGAVPTRQMPDRPPQNIYSQMAPPRDRPYPIPPRGNVTVGNRVRTTPLQQQRIDTGRDQIQRETQGLRTPPNIYGDARVAPNPYARPNLLNIFSPLPVMRGDQMGSQQTSNGGSRFGDWWRKLSPALQADDIATEAEVEAMNDSRSQMLTDLLAETSIEDEPRIVSRYKKKKKRSPKTWRSKARGYRQYQ
jgi:hypothetical protein